jgi:CBS domain-containing protein
MLGYSLRTLQRSRTKGKGPASTKIGRKVFYENILVGKRGNVVTIEPTADLTAAAKLLAERRIGAVVILGADHRIVGILSERDIVRALAEGARERAAMRGARPAPAACAALCVAMDRSPAAEALRDYVRQ